MLRVIESLTVSSPAWPLFSTQWTIGFAGPSAFGFFRCDVAYFSQIEQFMTWSTFFGSWDPCDDRERVRLLLPVPQAYLEAAAIVARSIVQVVRYFRCLREVRSSTSKMICRIQFTPQITIVPQTAATKWVILNPDTIQSVM